MAAKEVKGRDRFLYAGLGGTAPVLLSLIVIDLDTLLLDLTPLAVLSYLIRVLALFAIGGVVGWLHQRERDTVKLFQLGISAPALITATINGGRVELPDYTVTTQPSSASIWMASAHAAMPDWQAVLQQFTMPNESASQQFYRGLLGVTPKNVWYVIASVHGSQRVATKQAAKYQRKGFNAQVYAPQGTSKHYSVVIGAQLTRDKAKALRSRAIRAGLPKTTYLWTFPTH